MRNKGRVGIFTYKLSDFYLFTFPFSLKKTDCYILHSPFFIIDYSAYFSSARRSWIALLSAS